MLDPLKNSFLASLGLAAFAQEKLQHAVKELIERGEMTADQGKKLLDLFVSKGDEGSSDLSAKLSRELSRFIEKTPFVSRHEFEQLARRVDALDGGVSAETEGGAGAEADAGAATAPDEVNPS